MAGTYVYEFVSDLSPAQICQLFYVLSAAAVLALAVVPDTAQQLLTQYGARSSDDALALAPTLRHKDTGGELDDQHTRSLLRFISCLTSLGRIPHSWFIHFYILSISCTVFWAVQFVTHGTMLELIVKNQCSKSTSSMTMSQVVLVWVCMGLQGARRLYEYLVVLRPSSSRMWIIHWLLGNIFYLCTSVSIWVEGSSELQCPS
jgi:3-oxo-5-alpha-steroid 4-dehydrogenase 3 / polyprenol reductase